MARKNWLTRYIDDGRYTAVPSFYETLFTDNVFLEPFALPTKLNIDWRSTITQDMHITKNDDGSLKIEVPLPGAKKSDISVDVNDGTLTISIKKSDDKKDGVTESRFFTNDVWSASIAKNVDPTKIEARLLDGILTVLVPPTKESARHQIDVK